MAVAEEIAHWCILIWLCSVPFHHLRMVTFSNNVEPANGFLVRYLHRKLMESEDEKNLTNEDLIQVLDWVPKLWYHLHAFLEKHSTSDFLIGTRRTIGACRVFRAEGSRFKKKIWVLLSPPVSPQGLASSCRVLSRWRSSGRGSLTSGTTPSFRTCRRGPRTASRWETDREDRRAHGLPLSMSLPL